MGTEPIKHKGKSLRQILIFSQYFVAGIFAVDGFLFCSTYPLCVSPGLKRKSQNEDSFQGIGDVYNGPFAP